MESKILKEDIFEEILTKSFLSNKEMFINSCRNNFGKRDYFQVFNKVWFFKHKHCNFAVNYWNRLIDKENIANLNTI